VTAILVAGTRATVVATRLNRVLGRYFREVGIETCTSMLAITTLLASRSSNRASPPGMYFGDRRPRNQVQVTKLHDCEVE
jgi:hypothetical protein